MTQALTPEAKAILSKLLDPIDDLERAVRAADPEKNDAGLIEGLRQIHKQLSRILERHDLRSFASVGDRFDPHRHEAFGKTPSETIPEGCVAQVIKQGYLAGDRLFRPSQVLVSSGPPTEVAPTEAASTSPGRPQTASTTAATPKVDERSGVNVPDWLRTPPAAGHGRYHFVGRAKGAATVERGKAAAAEAVIPHLLDAIPVLYPDNPIGAVYQQAGQAARDRRIDGAWDRLQEARSDAARWVTDFYWHQLESDVAGDAYDVAVLVTLAQKTFDEIVSLHDAPERCAGLVVSDAGPLLRSLVADAPGVVVTEAGTGGLARATGLQPGDLITRVGGRPTPDKVTARRLLLMSARARKSYEIDFVRDFGAAQRVRIDASARLR